MAEPPAVPFVGAGPGDPGLLTVRGKTLLERAELVVHAGSLVNSELLDRYCESAERHSSIGMELEEIVGMIQSAYEEGRTVVRLHSGDPSIYGAALEQIDALATRNVPAYLVPGVTAAFAASATLGTQLTLNGVANHVAFTRPQGTTLEPANDHISEFVGMGDVTTCIYLGTHAVRETMDRLLDDGRDPSTPVTVVYHASWPDERIVTGTVETIADELSSSGISASALVIIGHVLSNGDYERSYLYGDWATGGTARETTTTTEHSTE
ncbi:cobalt-precorrin-4/precorrin-4 C(11)-methyltransferase [Halocatena halophila]|uniref:cobalt-precorrin-4/precorrin-4 C(11)-methyltransferase n=1 Tax=Halocatena halophila TaxID=2814576 RepID=UPI002ED65F33